MELAFCDRIYKLIVLPKEVEPFLMRAEFTALKEKLQLGPVKYYYPQARHTRHEHSLGAAYLAYIATKSISINSPNLGITNRDILCVVLAALYHDIGHGPYSHTYDHLLEERKFPYITAKHEARSIVIFDFIAKKINAEMNYNYLSIEEIEKVKFYIDPKLYPQVAKKEEPQHIRGLSEIVNNCYCQLDVDKMDYMIRDTKTLIPLSDMQDEIDIVGILKRSNIIDGHWSFHASDDLGIRGVFARRYMLYNNCYLKKDIMAIDYLVSESIVSMIHSHRYILECAKLENETDISKFCQLTDEKIDYLLLNTTDSPHMLDVREKMMKLIRNPSSVYECVADFAALENGEVDSGNDKDNQLYDCWHNIPKLFITKNKLASDKSDICIVMAKIPFYYKARNGETVVAVASQIRKHETIFISKMDRS